MAESDSVSSAEIGRLQTMAYRMAVEAASEVVYDDERLSQEDKRRVASAILHLELDLDPGEEIC